MTSASERGWPTMYVHLRYARPEAAIEWLVRVLAFREVSRASDPEQRLIVSELEGPEGGTVMVAALDDGFREWMRERVPEARWQDVVPYPWLAGSTSLLVSDVDEHCRRSRSHDATILDEPRDQPWGLRTYAVLDLEGHQWQFAQRLRAVAPEEWGAVRP